MKVDRWYDVTCGYCGKSVSTDFGGYGMQLNGKTAIAIARRLGFKTKAGINICSLCQKEQMQNSQSNGKPQLPTDAGAVQYE